MQGLQHLAKKAPDLEQRLHYTFQDKTLLILALIHRSFLNEHRDLVAQHNERLEFLGDSVLGLIIADYLYHRLPSSPEGHLSQLRSKLVDASSCAAYLQKLDLSDSILLGRGERLSDGNTKPSILADVFEAIVGAIYLDGGILAARSFILTHFQSLIDHILNSPPRNYKAELQDYSQKKYQKPPQYRIAHAVGPEHQKIFHVTVSIDDQEIGCGHGNSKKEAEQKAASDALSKLF